MPRRKKKVKEASEAQNLEKKDAETASSVNVKRKRKLEDAFIVISDSDGEEAKEENGLQKMKTKQSNRGRCLAKRKKIARTPHPGSTPVPFPSTSPQTCIS